MRDDLDARCPSSACRAMAERVGLDLSPVDPFSDDEALWLLACQWPDNPAAFRPPARPRWPTSAAAAHPPRLERGDMVTDLPGSPPPSPAPARWSCSTPGWPPTSTSRSSAPWPTQVRALGADRPVHHLYCESPFETPGLPTPPSPVPREGPDLATALVHIGPGGASPCAWPTPTRTGTGSAGGATNSSR